MFIEPAHGFQQVRRLHPDTTAVHTDPASPDHRHVKDWISDIIKHVDKNPKDLRPVIKEFKELMACSRRSRQKSPMQTTP